MSWSITDVARMAKVTSRTLRHYDEIGLLRPARIGANGYRYYEREQLLRLQEILLLREFGLGLDAIAAVLNGRRDRVDVLRAHHAALLAERDRLTRLANTVERTIADLQGGDHMPADEMFDGFAERQQRYENELVERFGPCVREQIAESRRRTAGWTKEDYLRNQQVMEGIEERLAELLRAGVALDDPRVFAVLDEHYAWLQPFWTPDRESYTGLGQLYADHPEFRDRYETRQLGLAEFLRDAMAAYAQARLD